VHLSDSILSPACRISLRFLGIPLLLVITAGLDAAC
jgi:hypothetical protein